MGRENSPERRGAVRDDVLEKGRIRVPGILENGEVALVGLLPRTGCENRLLRRGSPLSTATRMASDRRHAGAAVHLSHLLACLVFHGGTARPPWPSRVGECHAEDAAMSAVDRRRCLPIPLPRSRDPCRSRPFPPRLPVRGPRFPGRSASWPLTARPGLPARGGAPLTSNPEIRAALGAVAFHLDLACQLLGAPETGVRLGFRRRHGGRNRQFRPGVPVRVRGDVTVGEPRRTARPPGGRQPDTGRGRKRLSGTGFRGPNR